MGVAFEVGQAAGQDGWDYKRFGEGWGQNRSCSSHPNLGDFHMICIAIDYRHKLH